MDNHQDKHAKPKKNKRQELPNPYQAQQGAKYSEVTYDNKEQREKQVLQIEAKISQIKSKIASKQYKVVQEQNQLIQQEPLSQKQQRKQEREEKKKLLQEKRQHQQKLKEFKNILKEQKKQEKEEKKNQKKEEKEQRKSKLQKTQKIEQSASIFQQKEKNEDDCPDYLLCPITQTRMQSPYLLSVCGHTFQEYVIRQWLSKQQKCPLCSKSAQVDHLIKNYALAEVISSMK